MDDELIFDSGERITVKDGYRAIVRFEKLEATPKEVCMELIKLDAKDARVGDIKDLQRLAKVALKEDQDVEST